VKPERAELIGLTALLAGGLAIGCSGVLVRLSETGPIATAFWRGLFALPLLALWMRLEGRRAAPSGTPADTAPPSRWRFDAGLLWAGVFFAGDLAFWHLSLVRTSVAASTLEANCAPIVVTVLAWALYGERPRLGFLLATALALAGVVLIMSPHLEASGPGGRGLLGDALGLAAACSYGAYILAVSRLRARYGTGTVMFSSTLVYTVLLLPLALTERFLPVSAHGWLLLIVLALSAQALGQSLIAYALAHLPATLGSLGLYLNVIAAAVFAALILGERLTALQLVGGLVVLAGIALARAARSADRAHLKRASIQSSAPRHSESR
jgi:drug/metabolite transporter (DMT)-like permease